MASYIDLRKPFNRKLNRLYMGLQRAFNICKPLPGFPIYGGSVYCSLPYAAVQYILNCDLSPKILMSLKDSAIGEEIFFQTILMNSRFKDNIIHNNLRYSDWGVKNAPKILDESDFCKIIESTALFCRKVDQESSSKLLERLPLALEEDV